MKDRIVYSSEQGDMRSPDKKNRGAAAPTPGIKQDGIVRVRRESGGRGGKTVTVVHGMPFSESELSAFASGLKKKCGCGGSVKDGQIILQGDRVDTVISLLREAGHAVKRAGG